MIRHSWVNFFIFYPRLKVDIKLNSHLQELSRLYKIKMRHRCNQFFLERVRMNQ